MGEKYLTQKNIAWLSIILGVAGIVIPLIPYPQSESIGQFVISYLASFFLTIHLDFFNLNEFYIYSDFSDGSYFHYNFLNAFFYVLFILGGIFYLTLKSSRILRFLYSIIFVSKIYYFIFGLFLNFGTGDLMANLKAPMAFYLLSSYIFFILHIYVSYLILKYLEKEKELQVIIKEYESTSTTTLVETNLWQRFLHWIIDDFVLMLLFSGSIVSLTRVEAVTSFLMDIERVVGESFTVLIITAFFRFIYYIVFESILNNTPAKFLTKSRVTDEYGNKPTFGAIITRTLVRFIPFEAFTFFTGSGIHDTWSETYVIKESNAEIAEQRLK